MIDGSSMIGFPHVKADSERDTRLAHHWATTNESWINPEPLGCHTSAPTTELQKVRHKSITSGPPLKMKFGKRTYVNQTRWNMKKSCGQRSNSYLLPPYLLLVSGDHSHSMQNKLYETSMQSLIPIKVITASWNKF
jgi:hypothetical protein